MKWLSPADVQKQFSIGRTMAYQLIREFEKSGGEIIRIGRLTRVHEERFTDFLRGRNEEHAQ